MFTFRLPLFFVMGLLTLIWFSPSIQAANHVLNGLTPADWVQTPSQLTLAETTTYSQQAKLTASNSAVGDLFGIAVAVHNNTAIIGVELDDDAGENSGSAYVFTRTGGVWSQQAKLTPNDLAADDRFGYSVAIYGDTVVIGAYRDDDGGLSSGSAYVFTRNGEVWSQQAKLTASDSAAGDLFGVSVSVSNNIAVIGAYLDDDGGSASGSAYVFSRTAGVWSQQAKLTASDSAVNDQFGWSVAVSGDTAVIGANQDDDGGSASGSAYVFTNTAGVWGQQAKLTASDSAEGDRFGWSVAMSGDTAVIGADSDDDGGLSSGSAYVFTHTAGVWSQQAKLTASDPAASDQFGMSVSISGDTAVIGTPWDDDAGSASGSAYVFTRTAGVWSQQAKLTANDSAAEDIFGGSVAVYGDTAIIGAYGDDDGGINTGSAYIFVSNHPLIIATSGTGSGNVFSDPTGINCGGDCKEPFPPGTVITLTATANTGSTFIGWSGDVSSTANPITVTMDGAKAITATFALNEYELMTSTAGSGEGIVSPANGTYSYGTVITLTATANTGSTFIGWSGDVGSTANPITITMDGAKAITATFALNEYELMTSTAGSGEGIVSPANGTYPYGTVITLTATANTGSTFIGWSGDVSSTANPVTVTMDGAKAITATFALNEYTIALTAEPAKGGSVVGGGEFTYGQVVTVTATFGTGYTFVNWTENGEVVSTEASYSFTATAGRNLVAHFVVTPTPSPKIYLPLIMH